MIQRVKIISKAMGIRGIRSTLRRGIPKKSLTAMGDRGDAVDLLRLGEEILDQSFDPSDSPELAQSSAFSGAV
jgi:hypothetical protein